MGKYKIIFHFKSTPQSEEQIEEIKQKIKDFNENSLVIFSDYLKIHVIKEETDITKKFQKELNDINNNPLYDLNDYGKT
jgi:hypothetical protein